MNVALHRLTLPLEHAFTIARGSISQQRSLVVELSVDGVRGYGEVTENSFYGHTLESLAASVESVADTLASYQFGNPRELWSLLQSQLQEDYFALSALDVAAHDLYGKLMGQPTWQTLGLTWRQVPVSSYTIGIDDVDVMVAKLRQRPDWSVYKIKLGTAQDVHIIRELRKHTKALFRVDANCGWTPDETIANSHQLKELNVEFVEQPLPLTAERSEQERVFRQSALPILADESCQVEADVARCQGAFHGINVKLCKCGGLTPAVRMLHEARTRGLRTMVGCMVESSVGISAAAQLLPLLDYADLDGAVLLAKDPARGVTIDRGTVQLSDRMGTGAELLS